MSLKKKIQKLIKKTLKKIKKKNLMLKQKKI